MARTRAAARLAPRVPGDDQCDYRDEGDGGEGEAGDNFSKGEAA